jgi:hypothetical protein
MKFSQPRSSEVPESFEPIELRLGSDNRFSGTSGNSMPPENHSVILTKRRSQNKRSVLGKSWLLLKDGWSIQVIHRRYADNATLLVKTKNSSGKIARTKTKIFLLAIAGDNRHATIPIRLRNGATDQIDCFESRWITNSYLSRHLCRRNFQLEKLYDPQPLSRGQIELPDPSPGEIVKRIATLCTTVPLVG